MDDDVTSRFLADITMTTVTLAVKRGQMSLPGYVMTSWGQGCHIWVTTNITIRMVTLAVQH